MRMGAGTSITLLPFPIYKITSAICPFKVHLEPQPLHPAVELFPFLASKELHSFLSRPWFFCIFNLKFLSRCHPWPSLSKHRSSKHERGEALKNNLTLLEFRWNVGRTSVWIRNLAIDCSSSNARHWQHEFFRNTRRLQEQIWSTQLLQDQTLPNGSEVPVENPPRPCR